MVIFYSFLYVYQRVTYSIVQKERYLRSFFRSTETRCDSHKINIPDSQDCKEGHAPLTIDQDRQTERQTDR